MSIVLNLGISGELVFVVVVVVLIVCVANWQTIDLTTMMFPAEMLVDYVRVYQRKGSTNVGCNPKAYPTADYINNHLQAYRGMPFLCVLWYYYCESDVLLLDPNSTWTWKKPLNRLVRFVFFMCLPLSLIMFRSTMAVDICLLRKISGLRPSSSTCMIDITLLPPLFAVFRLIMYTNTPSVIASLCLVPSTVSL
jgi:hypothetical protein